MLTKSKGNPIARLEDLFRRNASQKEGIYMRYADFFDGKFRVSLFHRGEDRVAAAEGDTFESAIDVVLEQFDE